MNQIKMLLFSFDYPPNHGGISRLCAEISAGLGCHERGIHVLTQERPERGSVVPDVSETRIAPGRPGREWRGWRELRQRRDVGPVLSGIWYPEGLLATLAGMKPHVILAHGSELMPPPQRWRRPLWARLKQWVFSEADLVVANSEYTRRLVLACAPDCRAVAVPLAVDHERFRPGDREAARARHGVGDRLAICSVSRLCAYKGHDVVFKALAELPASCREQFVYLIAGRGPDRDALQAEAERLGVAPLVRWLGYVAEEDLPDLYRAADLFVLCTREAAERQEVEGFGLVFLEAQACGTPAVGTRTGGIPDAIRDGEGGWLIEQDDYGALSTILQRLAEDPAQFQEHGQAARARVERECTWNHYLDRFLAALEAGGIRHD